VGAELVESTVGVVMGAVGVLLSGRHWLSGVTDELVPGQREKVRSARTPSKFTVLSLVKRSSIRGEKEVTVSPRAAVPSSRF
jgi:hypothetical protein